jgi:hypothetical protein
MKNTDKILAKSVSSSVNGFWIEAIGWYGFVALMLAYALVSFKMIGGDSLLYQLLNLSGAFGLGVIAYFKKVYQSLVLQIIWGVIGVIAIMKMFL